MVTSLFYTKTKQERQSAQLAFFDACVNKLENDVYTSDHEFILELLNKWPQRLPKVIVSHMDKDMIQNWKLIKGIKRHMNIRALYGDDEREEYLEFIANEGLGLHLDKACKILELIQAIPDIISVTITFIPPCEMLKSSEEQSETYVFKMEGQPIDFRNQVTQIDSLRKISLCLLGGAGINIRQKLHLKIQRPNEQGIMKWFHQEKIYGIRVEMGTIYLCNDKEVRCSYNTDSQTGEALPIDLGTSFGNLKQINKSIKIIDNEWLISK